MARKQHALNLVVLFTDWSDERWNLYLNKMVKKNDLNGLLNARYGLQAGMDDLAKNKLNSQEWISKYLRWTMALEKACKHIFRLRHPNPLDKPNSNLSPDLYSKALTAKRARDNELEKMFKATGY